MSSLTDRSRYLLLLFLALALYSVCTGVAWNRYPAVWVDEGWVAEPAWVAAQGQPLGSPSHGQLHRYSDRVYWMPHLYFQLLSGVYRVGLPPLAGGRLLSFLAGLLTLLVLLVWGRSILTQRGGGRPQSTGFWPLLWLAALFTLAPMLWKVHRTIRFESVVGLWSVLAVALAWTPRRGRGLLAGAAAALAVLTHPVGAVTVAATVVVLWLRRPSVRSAVWDLASALLVLLLLCLPTALYFLQDRAHGFADVVGPNLPHLTGRAEGLLARLAEEPRRYLAFFAWPSLVLPLASWILTAVLALRTRAPRGLLAVVLVFALGLALLPNKTELYLTLLAPFLYLLAAWVGAASPRRWIAAWAVVWVLVLAAADGSLLRRNRDCRYAEWANALAAPVPSGASVAGTFVTWFAFEKHPYLEVHRWRAGDLYDAAPAYLVWGDRHMQEPIFERLRRELGPFLAAHAEEVAVSASDCYGDAILYRPRWKEADPREAEGWERLREGDGS